MGELKVQLHYEFFDNDSHLLDFYTRKACSDAQVRILETIIDILYPGTKYQIFSTPDQEGSFKDNTIVKFFNDNQGAVTAVAAVVGIVLAGILFKGDFENNKTSAQLNTLEIIEKCRELGLDDMQISLLENDICNSFGIKADKNSFYESITMDKDVSEIHPKVSDDAEEVIFDSTIPKKNFKLYLEDIPKHKEYIKEGQFGHIEVAQPFILKQQRFGRGAAWRGVYYGNDIVDDDAENAKILLDGESVFFYMQDEEYKVRILSQEISFKSGDNIKVLFNIGRYYNYLSKEYGNPRLYITKVVSHNDDLINHKKELDTRRKQKKLEEQNKNQSRFEFNDTE